MDLETLDALITAGIAASRAEAVRWALARIREGPAYAFAYLQQIETGLRLSSLAGTLRLRRVTREWSRHLEGIGLLRAWLQLEVAALARSAGAAVEFETFTPEVSRPADVTVTAGPARPIAEGHRAPAR